MTQRFPALFLGHGSPMMLISDTAERRAMSVLGQRLPRPRAVLAISAHWQTQGRTHYTAAPWPRTIHDFGGFPDALYQVRYPAPGSDWLQDRLADLLGEQGQPDRDWGFDHGTYGVLLPLFGEDYVPTVAMSLDRSLDPAGFIALGRALAPLREEGVLIVGSGNVVHNLSLWRQSQGTQPDWAVEFQGRINHAMVSADSTALSTFQADDRAAALAINSGEHYLPLLPSHGARMPGDTVGVFNDTVDGALSMTSYLIGDAALVEGLGQ
ncbi:class III extradiol ring-cleavage dioxygenase [Novosphingobium sp. TH158]|uniref:DODA-type extradiol aromatic ring-opening family dioxygenase n=1 Tax=Novosphingobium sp. TH158 TaxID=2067455 RepID=UPI000C7E1FEE|nr:class III extradiol ring-cleavage dioxygenase [Novosphingobium sp. TH158]PLK25918.1 4,5-DOPA dioxygenase extradiol [Novosphingobium sp. TH158]